MKMSITDDDREYAAKLKLLDLATRRSILDGILACAVCCFGR